MLVKMQRLFILFLCFSFHLQLCYTNYCDADNLDCRKDGQNPSLHGKLLVAAIDFGTTYSGWAFSFKHEYARDPTDITFSQWSSGEYLSEKAPTTVLIKPDGKTLDSFGYEAETRYAELAAENEQDDYYFFKRFKMMLHGVQDLSRHTTIVDTKGHTLPAMTVFALAIQYLKQNLMETLQQREPNLEETDIHWVLTVPAIWNDAAKQFMREAAVQGGINNKDLRIALEPEAASLYCRLMPAEKILDHRGNSVIATFKRGHKYMVLDAGGGTVDISVHQVMDNGNLKELYKASGGPWGGTRVDEAFFNMLESILGPTVLAQFKSRCDYDHLHLLRDFEIKKRDISPSKDKKFILRIPECLRNLTLHITGQTIKDKIAFSSYEGRMKLTNDKMTISADIGKELFRVVINSVVEKVGTLFEEPNVMETNTILMVGGFSQSPLLQDAMRSKFSDKKIIIPKDAGLAVVKGAVIFGYDPSAITERVCKYTYGVAVSATYIEGVHDPKKKVYLENGFYILDVFDKFVEAGQSVRYGEPQGYKVYTPLTEHQTSLGISVYACMQKSPTYVYDKGCSRLGSILVSLRQRSVPLYERATTVSLTIGGTEIEVLAIELQTGEETLSSVNFLG